MIIKITNKQIGNLLDDRLTFGKRYSSDVNLILDNLSHERLIDLYNEIYHNSYEYAKKGYIKNDKNLPFYEINLGGNERPTILIVSGVHGDEKSSVIGSFLTFKNFCYSQDKIHNFVLDNFSLIFVPCINVSGFNTNSRNNKNDVDLNRDFINTTQYETKALTSFIEENKSRIKMILDSHNAYNEQYISCKNNMPYFQMYSDALIKLKAYDIINNSDLGYCSDLFISESVNDGTLSDYINLNGFIGHTVEAPRSFRKKIEYGDRPNNYLDASFGTVFLLTNLIYLYGKMFINKEFKDETIHNK